MSSVMVNADIEARTFEYLGQSFEVFPYGQTLVRVVGSMECGDHVRVHDFDAHLARGTSETTLHKLAARTMRSGIVAKTSDLESDLAGCLALADVPFTSTLYVPWTRV